MPRERIIPYSNPNLLGGENPDFAVVEAIVAGNRGPCGGVNMTKEAGYQVLDLVDGREPVYTNWPLINNVPFMQEMESRGMISVNNDWTQVPREAIVFFSAHGVPPSFHDIARENEYTVIDTTCQLVNRVHNLAKRGERNGQHIVYIGVDGHPETVGVMGEIKPENRTLIEKAEDVDGIIEKFVDGKAKFYEQKIEEEALKSTAEYLGEELLVLSQTTLSTDEIRQTLQRISERFPHAEIPNRWDICYATDNRQQAVDNLLPVIDLLMVVGSEKSHNSTMLQHKALKAGIPAYLFDRAEKIKSEWFNQSIRRVGVTSGASVFEHYTNEVLQLLTDRNIPVQYQLPAAQEEDMTFKLPIKDIASLYRHLNSKYGDPLPTKSAV